jgi:ubiquinone/menaquinone biosynthesis C-methylase UbiE
MNEGFLNPNEIIKNVSLKSNMNACDLGCGSGGWVIPLAKQLKEGTVYAVDILDEALSALESKVSAQNLSNVKTLKGDIEENIKLREEYFDLVLMTNLLFQVENRPKVMELAKNLINQNGMILIVDWKKDAPMGSSEGRISLQDAKEMASNLGLKIEKEFIAGSFHWGLILKKL